jgi:hypothetical protein
MWSSEYFREKTSPASLPLKPWNAPGGQVFRSFEAFMVGSFPTAKNEGVCIEIWRTLHLKIVHVVVIIFSMAKTASRSGNPYSSYPVDRKLGRCELVLSPGRI